MLAGPEEEAVPFSTPPVTLARGSGAGSSVPAPHVFRVLLGRLALAGVVVALVPVHDRVVRDVPGEGTAWPSIGGYLAPS